MCVQLGQCISDTHTTSKCAGARVRGGNRQSKTKKKEREEDGKREEGRGEERRGEERRGEEDISVFLFNS